MGTAVETTAEGQKAQETGLSPRGEWLMAQIAQALDIVRAAASDGLSATWTDRMEVVAFKLVLDRLIQDGEE